MATGLCRLPLVPLSFELTSSSAQVGNAVAALLSLPVTSQSNSSASLSTFANKLIYVNSFTISQRDILASVLRVTGTQESDWTVSHEPSRDRYNAGLAEIKEGKRVGFAKMMYTRVFFPDGGGDFESGRGTANALLQLPQEDLDAATGRAIERAKNTESWA